MSKFALCLCNHGIPDGDRERRRIISESSYRLMTTNHLHPMTIRELAFENTFSETVGDGIGFGLGVSILVDPKRAKGASLSSVGEFGWGGVASTWMMIDPEQQLVTLLLTQLVPSSSYPIRSQLRWLSHWATAGVNFADQEGGDIEASDDYSKPPGMSAFI